jgi:hypothetical protein
MQEEWEQFDVFGNRASAASLVGLLHTEGVPALIDESSPLPGLDEAFRVMVPSRLARRARWVMAAMDITESELGSLATGELRGPERDAEP